MVTTRAGAWSSRKTRKTYQTLNRLTNTTLGVVSLMLLLTARAAVMLWWHCAAAAAATEVPTLARVVLGGAGVKWGLSATSCCWPGSPLPSVAALDPCVVAPSSVSRGGGTLVFLVNRLLGICSRLVPASSSGSWLSWLAPPGCACLLLLVLGTRWGARMHVKR